MPAVDYPGCEAGDDTVIWRYMRTNHFMDLLAGRLYFAAAHQFGDQFEGAITQAEQVRRRELALRTFPNAGETQQHLQGLSRAFADLRRMTKINCWHARPHENVAMWERYRRSTDCGVVVASTVGALKQSLHEFRLKPEYGHETISVGRVRYIDYAADEMVDRSMLGIFLHKRIEYQDETEIRALLSLRMAAEFAVPIPYDGVTVSVDPVKLISEVRACPAATPDEVAMLVEATRAAGLQSPVTRSTLGSAPAY